MPHEYHENRARYFEHQRQVTVDHVIPFIEESAAIPAEAEVLEIGCAEAGVLRAFVERGATGVGVDRSAHRLATGRKLAAPEIESGQLELLERDAHDLAKEERFAGRFHLIVLKDVIEHVEARDELFDSMRRLLAPGGRVFLSFPPWRMPFGGHQQMCRSRWLSRLPYFHLLPRPAYRGVLELFGETAGRVESLLETQATRLSIEDFEALCRRARYVVLGRRHYLVNPMYRYRFGLSEREQAGFVAHLPALRDFVTTCAYYVIAPSLGD